MAHREQLLETVPLANGAIVHDQVFGSSLEGDACPLQDIEEVGIEARQPIIAADDHALTIKVLETLGMSSEQLEPFADYGALLGRVDQQTTRYLLDHNDPRSQSELTAHIPLSAFELTFEQLLGRYDAAYHPNTSKRFRSTYVLEWLWKQYSSRNHTQGRPFGLNLTVENTPELPDEGKSEMPGHEGSQVDDLAMIGLLGIGQTVPQQQTLLAQEKADALAQSVVVSPLSVMEYLVLQAKRRHEGSTLPLFDTGVVETVFANYPRRLTHSRVARLLHLQNPKVPKARGDDTGLWLTSTSTNFSGGRQGTRRVVEIDPSR